MENEFVYVILSQSGSIVSKFLKLFTKDKYNHVSVSLTENLSEMYSFSRYYSYMPFYGGFVQESVHKGPLKRFKNAVGVVLKLPATVEQKESISERFKQMFSSKRKYRYDMLGVFMASMGKFKRRDYRYYCSSFVKSVLEESGIIEKNVLPLVVKPIDFLTLKNVEFVYDGNIHEYVKSVNEKQK